MSCIICGIAEGDIDLFHQCIECSSLFCTGCVRFNGAVCEAYMSSICQRSKYLASGQSVFAHKLVACLQCKGHDLTNVRAIARSRIGYKNWTCFRCRRREDRFVPFSHCVKCNRKWCEHCEGLLGKPIIAAYKCSFCTHDVKWHEYSTCPFCDGDTELKEAIAGHLVQVLLGNSEEALELAGLPRTDVVKAAIANITGGEVPRKKRIHDE